MGESLLAVYVGLLLIYGGYRIKQAVCGKERPVLCLVLEGREDFAEGVVRHLVWKLRLAADPARLLLFAEAADDKSGAVLQRLAEQLNFDVCLLRGDTVPCDVDVAAAASGAVSAGMFRLIDMRGHKNFIEQYRTIERML